MKHKGLVITLIVIVVIAIILGVFGGIGYFVYKLINKTKDPITAAKFENTMEDMDFDVYDITDEYEEYDYVEKVIIAIEEDDNYQIEFYQLENEAKATLFYNNNADIFKDSASSVKTSTSNSFKNGEVFKLTSNGQYMLVSRIEDTVIYVDADDEYKDEINEILEKLGY